VNGFFSNANWNGTRKQKMFVLNEMEQSGAGGSEENLVPPSENASLVEVMTYNLKRMQRDYLGDSVQAKLTRNAMLFCTAVILMNQSGHRLAV